MDHRRMFGIRILGLFVLCAAQLAIGAQPWSLPAYVSVSDTPYVVETRKGIVYGRGATSRGDMDLLMDVYLPTKLAGKPKAAIVFVHGGGFVAGNRSSMAAYCQAFARKGFAAFTISYRLTTDSPSVQLSGYSSSMLQAMRAANIDTKAAIRHLYANAGTYGIDTGNIFLGGASAGAITSLVVGATPPLTYASDSIGNPPRPENNPTQPTRVRAIVDWCGAMYNDLSQLDATDPPIMIYHGDADRTVAYSEATKLKAKCDALGLECEFHSVPGGGHCPQTGAAAGSVLSVMTSFVMRHAASPTSSTAGKSNRFDFPRWVRVDDGSLVLAGLPESVHELEVVSLDGRSFPSRMSESHAGWKVRIDASNPGVAVVRARFGKGESRSWIVPMLR